MAEVKISFDEFAREEKMSSLRRAGFEAHLRLQGQTFNFRERGEWKTLYSDFMRQVRGRR